MVAPDTRERCQQHPGIGGDAQPAFFGDVDGRFADQRRVRKTLRRYELLRDRVHLAGVHEVAALRLELALDLLGNRFVDDN